CFTMLYYHVPPTCNLLLYGPELGRFWKYRVGDYRLICHIQDGRITVLVLRVGHRRDIYR
ncbi:MAG: type II toxin-antitoxin system RelE/ParE family toxin, partial [Meiothermus silvanus]|nr:type II toxin-antitoxin system RelE/ParE family toxin [Allomeiothermus silvanus]